MPITVHHEPHGICRLDISGLLRQTELEGAEQSVAAEIDRIGAVKLLVVLDGFEGWERKGSWEATFYMKHGDDIARIAIVGPERWRTEMLMFAAAGLRKGPVQYFPGEAFGIAKAWLSA